MGQCREYTQSLVTVVTQYKKIKIRRNHEYPHCREEGNVSRDEFRSNGGIRTWRTSTSRVRDVSTSDVSRLWPGSEIWCCRENTETLLLPSFQGGGMILCGGGPTDLAFGIVCRTFGRKVDTCRQIWHGLPRGVRAVVKWRTFLGRWDTTRVFLGSGFRAV